MFDLLVVFGVALFFIQIIRIFFSDCDLHLQWYCKFGETPASLKGKVVWITGASSGIGEALAYKLSSVGCKLILSARREDRLKQVKDHCLKQNPGIGTKDILILPLDLLDFGSHANAVEVVLKYFKKIDVLVNNAGRSQRALWENTSLEVDKAMLNVNVLGLLSLTKCILPQMIKQNYGRIVITSSLAGKLGAPGLGSYSGSKHALHGWFEALRIEGYNYNIDVTMVCPGPVFSEALLHAFTESGEKTLGVEMKPTEKRMTAERCAYLMSVAMANDLDEVWLSGNPELFFLYLYQYFPTITRRLGRRIGAKRVKKLQSGMTNLH
ncbi:dehydrogenase/reductase SDR family member 7-like [Mytilus trossulus]|uniref:dehydrogenase/reductase SDR family member 7-like n=1 Tax=Mytilus trossulus TaxID=6551 RepID=UPI00300679A9